MTPYHFRQREIVTRIANSASQRTHEARIRGEQVDFEHYKV